MRRFRSNFHTALPVVAGHIPLSPSYFEIVSLERYIEIYAKRSNEIQYAQVIPPVIGAPGFGQVLIRWKKPVYTQTGPIIQTNE